VFGLSAVSETDVAPIGHMLAGVELVTGGAKLPGRILLLHNLDRLLDDNELILLNAAKGEVEDTSTAQSPG
jgi:hypothetical protein